MTDFDAYEHRSGIFQKVERNTWESWIWQQQNAVRNAGRLQKVFPRFPSENLALAREWERRGFRFMLTPYVLSLVGKDEAGNPLMNDPVWRQFFPAFPETVDSGQIPGPDEYVAEKENWEVPEEMITPIAQHKYDNRVIIYAADSCLGYCLYCFRSLQSGAERERHGGRPFWRQTMDAIRNLPEVEEVILSGGDPLVYDNKNVEEMLSDIRSISHVKAIRIHTRAWTHNPYRIDREFCGLLKRHDVTEMGVHAVHPKEITADFLGAVDRVRTGGARTLLLSDTPLIKGINDDAGILHDLFMSLYTAGIKPYYLSHNMPNIPAARMQRTSVKRGVQLLNSLKRRISNAAMPEYIITHRSGKKTVPECERGTPDFIYDQNENGHPIIRFKNWKNEWHSYLDGID